MKKTLLMAAVAAALMISCKEDYSFCLSDAVILSDSRESPEVYDTALSLRGDITAVTGKPAPKSHRKTIIMGTVGRSQYIRRMADAGLIDVSDIKGVPGQYLIQKVDDRTFVVAGSDVIGLACGAKHLGERIGVNQFDPDAPVVHRRKAIVDGTRYVSNAASNKYLELVLPEGEYN